MAKQGAEDDTGTGLSLIGRLVFSLLRAAVRVAARAELPLTQVQELLRTAYFAEYRRRHPRDLATVAGKLGVSLRTAGTLNRQLRDPAFTAETHEAPTRSITGRLAEGPASLDTLVADCALDPDEAPALVDRLVQMSWVHLQDDGTYALTGHLRVFVDEDHHRRVDAVGHQLEIVADAVWARFVKLDEATAGARSWAFVAQPEEVAAALQRTTAHLRAEAVAMETAALASEGPRHRYAITVAFSPLEEET